ncbi:MAG TPA: hypothetical protein QGF60_01210, partial [Candidatus Paceibacterota bacterium]|nr:hypothetical protein [Candidatus Paceibacterota bacterium]
MTSFQIGIIAVFVIFAVIGVLAFSGIGGIGGNDNEIGKVQIWGTVPQELMDAMFNDINIEIDNFVGVNYT